MSEDSAIEVRFTLPFKRRLKSLSKRYRQIQKVLITAPYLSFLLLVKFTKNSQQN